MSESEMALQVGAEHYFDATYNSRERLYSFAEQVSVTQSLEPKLVLEVGVGNGYLTRSLREAGISVRTLDFDSTLRPDIVASVDQIPMDDRSADVVTCFQVLEHLPFDRFKASMGELARVAGKWVFMSLPDARSSIRFEIARRCTGKNPIRFALNGIPFRKSVVHVFDGQHYWEVGKRDTPESRVIDTMTVPGLTLERHYRLHHFPYHHFFLLRKSQS